MRPDMKSHLSDKSRERYGISRFGIVYDDEKTKF